MDIGANGENGVIAPAVDVSVADSSAEAEVMAANNGSVETEQSFLEDDTEESPAAPKEGAEKSESEKRGEELNDNEDVLSSQDEGATSQEEDEDDEEVIVNSVDATECPKVGGVTVVVPRILKAEDSKGEDKENVAVVADPDGGESEDDGQNEGEEGQEDEEEEDEEEEDDEDEDDPMVAGALAAKANGSVNEWVDHLDEIDPCHRLRSLCKKGDIEGLTQLLWVFRLKGILSCYEE